MRTFEEAEYDNKRQQTAAAGVFGSLKDFTEILKDIHTRKCKTEDCVYDKQDIDNLDACIRSFMGENNNVNAVLNIARQFSFDEPKYLDSDWKCPSCKTAFPYDLWQWYDTLFCPYCGQRVWQPRQSENQP